MPTLFSSTRAWLTAGAVLGAAVAATPAQAYYYGYGPRFGYYPRAIYFAPRPVYFARPPVYYAPYYRPPIVYAAPPVYAPTYAPTYVPLAPRRAAARTRIVPRVCAVPASESPFAGAGQATAIPASTALQDRPQSAPNKDVYPPEAAFHGD